MRFIVDALKNILLIRRKYIETWLKIIFWQSKITDNLTLVRNQRGPWTKFDILWGPTMISPFPSTLDKQGWLEKGRHNRISFENTTFALRWNYHHYHHEYLLFAPAVIAVSGRHLQRVLSPASRCPIICSTGN